MGDIEASAEIVAVTNVEALSRPLVAQTLTLNWAVRGTIERTASITATGTVQATGRMPLVERTASITATGTVQATGRLPLTRRTATITATGSVQTTGRTLLTQRQAAITATTYTSVGKLFPGPDAWPGPIYPSDYGFELDHVRTTQIIATTNVGANHQIIGLPPDIESHPLLAGIYQPHQTNGNISRLSRNGVYSSRVRDGQPTTTARGGIHDQTTTGGEYDQNLNSGRYDEMLTGGLIL